VKKDNHTALITGATGFIGSNLAKVLVREGWNVHAIVRSTSSSAQLEGIMNHINTHVHDGSMDNMLKIIEAVSPSVVFHLASLFLASHRPPDIRPLIESNILFATYLVEAMANCGKPKLINTGTSWQHFENREYSPVCLYAATKQAFEAILRFYVEASGLRVITLKLFDTYGPNDKRPKLFSALRKASKNATQLSMSEGKQLIDLVYIDDVVDAFLVAAKRHESDRVSGMEVYAVSSGNPISLREVVDTYTGIVRRPVNIDWGGKPYRQREVMIPWSNGDPLPGWRARVSLEEGIRRMEGTGDLPNVKDFCLI
jgi:nucleoside-diphosphate-sugar epimerase